MTRRWDTSFPEPYDGREDDTGQVGRGPYGLYYRCETCGWTGRGGPLAYTHHTENPAHRILLRDMPQLGPVPFGCCAIHQMLVTPNAGGKDDR